MEALRQRDELVLKALRAAGDAGIASLEKYGPQLESDEEFEAFMDEAEANALRQ
jgi:hypothetical protein